MSYFRKVIKLGFISIRVPLTLKHLTQFPHHSSGLPLSYIKLET